MLLLCLRSLDVLICYYSVMITECQSNIFVIKVNGKYRSIFNLHNASLIYIQIITIAPTDRPITDDVFCLTPLCRKQP